MVIALFLHAFSILKKFEIEIFYESLVSTCKYL